MRLLLRILLTIILLALQPAVSASRQEDFLSKMQDEWGLTGFGEIRYGKRTGDDPHEDDVPLAEIRIQLGIEKDLPDALFKMKTDFIYDDVPDSLDIDLETGEGWIDLREANIEFSPFDFMDVKAGRQILTWGTGDLIFINDLFPKDWNSFFIGRDTEYLKAPSDALKVSLFADAANLDIVYTPRFDPDRFIDGRRISYYNSALGRTAGRDAIVETAKPDNWFDDDEVALRIYRNLSGYELAAYVYRGYSKSPGGIDLATGLALFPRLNVYGASVRGNFLKGIGSAEIGWYDSRDDTDGDDPFINNGEFRFLIGYDQEVATDFTVGIQYYLERMLDYGEYLATLPEELPVQDENRHSITLRLTKMLMNQNFTMSLYTRYSPSDEDIYLKPVANYRVNDNLSVEAGGNIFFGEEDHTFQGQFEDNSSLYAAVRYTF